MDRGDAAETRAALLGAGDGRSTAAVAARAHYVTGFTGLATQFQSHVTQYPPYGGPLV